MSQRTLLISALALMAGGLLFGGLGVVVGGGMGPAGTRQGVGLPGQPGPAGGFQPHRPGGGTWRIVPAPSASPTQ